MKAPEPGQYLRSQDGVGRTLTSNLVLSALVFASGRLAPLRKLWLERRIVPLVAKDTAAELVRVLSYPKFKLDARDQHELLADYLPYCRVSRIPAPTPRSWSIPECRDPHDLPFLRLALAGNAKALITGDRDLLVLAGQFSTPILRAEEFLQQFRD